LVSVIRSPVDPAKETTMEGMTLYDAYTQLIDKAEAVRNACANDSDAEFRMNGIIDHLINVRNRLSPLMARMPYQGGAL
jgi:hypothetical protein